MVNNTFGLLFNITHERSYKSLFVLVLLAILSACTSHPQQLSLTTPETGKANVIGKVQSSQGIPYENINLRLAEVYWQDGMGAYVMDESFSPGGITDSDGKFQILNAPAGEYVVIIGKPNQEYKAITDSDGILKRITIESGETLDLGTIIFDY